MKNIISWFEIPAANFERAKTFYETIFGIQMSVQSFEGLQMAFFPSDAGIVSGSVVHHGAYVPSENGVLIYLNCGTDLSPVLEKIEEAGGKILKSKSLIGEEWGYMALFTDSEGNRLALHSLH